MSGVAVGVGVGAGVFVGAAVSEGSGVSVGGGKDGVLLQLTSMSINERINSVFK
jgi:hypothetical protein